MKCASDLADAFVATHPKEAARVLEELSLAESVEYLHSLTAPAAAAVLSQMITATAGLCLSKLKAEPVQQILSILPLDTAAILLRSLSPDERNKLLKLLAPQTAEAIRLLLEYPPQSAGALMDPQVVAWPHDMRVSVCLEQIQRAAQQTVSYLYVIDDAKKLVGVLGYQELIGVDDEALLSSLMTPPTAHLVADASLESIVVHPGWRDYHALPVTDDGGRFLGVLRYRTFRRLEAQMSTEAHSPVHVALSLGELCWVGMTAVWDSLITVTSNQPKQES